MDEPPQMAHIEGVCKTLEDLDEYLLTKLGSTSGVPLACVVRSSVQLPEDVDSKDSPSYGNPSSVEAGNG